MEQGSQSLEQEPQPNEAAGIPDSVASNSASAGPDLVASALVSGAAAMPRPEVVPNPRGGTVPGAERALGVAIDAFDAGADAAGALVQAANALRAAGWTSALRYTEALLFAVPHVADEPSQRDFFGNALRDFRTAVCRHNLWELACSDELFAHYEVLRGFLAEAPLPATTTLDELALAGRAVPTATLYAVLPAAEVALWRARYERALLSVLRAADQNSAAAGLDTLDTCFTALAGPDPYDACRLAAGALKVLRSSERACTPEAKRLYARFNLVFGEQARGSRAASAATVRYALALLWRGFALYGSSLEDREAVELLRDYGLSINWQSRQGGALRSLWDADALVRERSSNSETGQMGEAGEASIPEYAQQPGLPIPRQLLRGIGALRVHVVVYEDFLQTAEAAIAALTNYAAAAAADKPDASAALQAGDAAYQLGATACAVGLGGVATLADALGLAWRRVAHAAAGSAVCVSTNAHVLEDGAEALRRMLHQVAAGVAPADPSASLAGLIALIESDQRG